MESDRAARKPLSVNGSPNSRAKESSLPLPPQAGGAAQSSAPANHDRQQHRALQSFVDSMTFAAGSGNFGSGVPMRPPSCPCCR